MGKARLATGLWSGAAASESAAVRADPDLGLAHDTVAARPTGSTRASRVDGLVAQPVALTYEELLRMPRAEQVWHFHCVTGWSVKNVHWAGVRFPYLLATAGPRQRGSVLTFVSAERPYVDTLTLGQAGLADAMLAYEMDGEPLRASTARRSGS